MHRGTALRHTVRRGGLTAVTLGCLLLVGSLPWIRLNLSSSLPRGFYRLHPVPDTLTHGTLAVVPVPAIMRPWYTAWAPLLKPVAGVEGDVLTIQDGRFYINDTDYGPVQRSAGGRPLPHVSSPLCLDAGEVCLASPAPRSLDCRYFGPLPHAHITAIATPLWTWRDAL